MEACPENLSLLRMSATVLQTAAVHRDVAFLFNKFLEREPWTIASLVGQNSIPESMED